MKKLLLPLMCFFMLWVPGCSKPAVFKRSAMLMGTFVEITVWHDRNDRHAQTAVDAAFDKAWQLEKLLSRYEENSDVSKINNSAGIKWVKVSRDTFSVIKQALQYSKLTNGAFDITVAPLMKLWDFDGKGQIPSDAELKKTIALVDYQNIKMMPGQYKVKLTKQGMELDLGGIAKGYVVDEMVSVLKGKGVNTAVINAGGDIYAIGAPAPKKYYSIGIRDPRSRKQIARVMHARDEAVTTSGDYENFFLRQGTRYSHILDPQNGKPVGGTRSVTVTAPTTVEADALSTALFVMGKTEGSKLIEQMENVEAIFLP